MCALGYLQIWLFNISISPGCLPLAELDSSLSQISQYWVLQLSQTVDSKTFCFYFEFWKKKSTLHRYNLIRFTLLKTSLISKDGCGVHGYQWDSLWRLWRPRGQVCKAYFIRWPWIFRSNGSRFDLWNHTGTYINDVRSFVVPPTPLFTFQCPIFWTRQNWLIS